MQRDEILEFIERVDAHLAKKRGIELGGEKFALKIFGKSALLLAGLTDTLGTKDIDLLRIESGSASKYANITKELEKEFGRANVVVHDFYLEFVAPSFAFIPPEQQWNSTGREYQYLSAQFLRPEDVVAAKLFSAYADTPRRQDKQDIVAALDQKLVSLSEICKTADLIFAGYELDARSDRFPDVYRYLTEDLMPNYGSAKLKYQPD